MILPGLGRGEVEEVTKAAGVPAVLGPRDLRDLPDYFGTSSGPPADYGRFDIDILAEINHCPKLSLESIRTIARGYRESGADVIDLGCDPGSTWTGVADAVRG